MRKIFGLIAFTLLFIPAYSQLFQYADDNPIELGKVHWLRNYDKAVEQSQESDKPIFLLFQEVPGCGNCTKYGKDILSHPLIVEAIEDLFVPLAIYNNVGGHDREVLQHYKEPTWNNPVVRVVDSNGAPVGKRIADFRSVSLLLDQMILALDKSKKDVPEYLSLLREEYAAQENGVNEFYLSMYCFWTGEKEISKIKGVVGTEAGWMHGREVVKVTYDSDETSESYIAQKAAKAKCADQVFSNEKATNKVPFKKKGKYRKDSQDKYYLLQTKYKGIPMTELQKAKVNSALGSRQNPEKYLSPRQLKILKSSRLDENFIESEFVKSWYESVGR